MSFNHVIKLLVNLFVFLLSAWGEDESRLELWALAVFVLLLAQCLVCPTTRTMDGGRNRWRDEGRDGWMQQMMKGQGDKGKKRKERWEEGSGFIERYLHTVSVCWSSNQCPRLFSCTCPQTRGCGRPSRLRRGLGCHSRLGPSFSMSENKAVAQQSWRAFGVGKSNLGKQFGWDKYEDELWGVAF